MKKSELYARYNMFNQDIQEIDMLEFYEHFTHDNKEFISFEEDGSTAITTIKLDGCSYIRYNSHWSVGWQGDIDSDSFYCKLETMTKAERNELQALFTSDAF